MGAKTVKFKGSSRNAPRTRRRGEGSEGGESIGKVETIRQRGEVVEAYPGSTFKVKLEDGREALCHVSGRMRKYYIKILPGDKVIVEFTPYDLTRGRIVYRES